MGHGAQVVVVTMGPAAATQTDVPTLAPTISSARTSTGLGKRGQLLPKEAQPRESWAAASVCHSFILGIGLVPAVRSEGPDVTCRKSVALPARTTGALGDCGGVHAKFPLAGLGGLVVGLCGPALRGVVTVPRQLLSHCPLAALGGLPILRGSLAVPCHAAIAARTCDAALQDWVGAVMLVLFWKGAATLRGEAA